ncbi:hypothetical protein CALVIDRAFT_542767 [Calocera viscosa TUFC12733]|uniref:TPX2 C-terminal domain-containing protein n=1 Tax=Calocera viscosa (strain TUFC12733) TaxID=1330018 RepID=A0A167GAP6_CALVF|nr:hypothetical protein CALVIDRAFT_542767 [Calocera viscosa TUFC12733]
MPTSSPLSLPSQYLPTPTPSSGHPSNGNDTPDSSFLLPKLGDASMLKDVKMQWDDEGSVVVPPFPPPRKATMVHERARKRAVSPKKRMGEMESVQEREEVLRPVPAAVGFVRRELIRPPVEPVVEDIEMVEEVPFIDTTRKKRQSRRRREELPDLPPVLAPQALQTAHSVKEPVHTPPPEAPHIVEVKPERSKEKKERKEKKEKKVHIRTPIEEREAQDVNPYAGMDSKTTTKPSGGEARPKSSSKAKTALPSARPSSPGKARAAARSTSPSKTQAISTAIAPSKKASLPSPPTVPAPAPPAYPSPPANLPADETCPLPPPTPSALRQQQHQHPAPPAQATGESSDDASFGGLMEKLKFYREKIGVGQPSSDPLSSSASETTPPPVPAVQAPPSAQATMEHPAVLPVTLPAAAPPKPTPADTLPQPAMSLLAKLEAAARQTVRSVLPPPSPVRRPPRPAEYVPPEPAAPAAQPAPPAAAALQPATSANARKRAIVNDENMRPVKRPRQTTVLTQKENARAAGGSKRSNRKSPVKPQMRSAARPVLTATVAQAEPENTRVKVVAKRKEDVEKKQQLEQASEKIRVLEEKKQVLVESIQAKHRIPSTSFEPVLPPVVLQKHKQAFASTRAAWESRSKPRQSNYHPPPNWAALHAQEEIRKSRVASTLEHKPIVPQPFAMATEARAKEREEFERLIREKEELLEELKEQRRLEQEQKEREETEKLRKELDEKARENVHLPPDWMRKRAVKLKQ